MNAPVLGEVVACHPEEQCANDACGRGNEEGKLETVAVCEPSIVCAVLGIEHIRNLIRR